MKNKNVGFLIVGIGVIMGVMVWLFNNLIKDNIGLTCSHGPTREMYTSLNVQTWVSFLIVIVILIIGFVIMFSKPEERVVIKTKTKKILEKKSPVDKSKLDNKEKRVIEILEKENGTMFQADLMEKLEIGKVGITRLLDKLEAKQLIERKRRGMNNVVVLR
jgi:uncharacterized membrane protein